MSCSLDVRMPCYSLLMPCYSLLMSCSLDVVLSLVRMSCSLDVRMSCYSLLMSCYSLLMSCYSLLMPCSQDSLCLLPTNGLLLAVTLVAVTLGQGSLSQESYYNLLLLKQPITHYRVTIYWPNLVTLVRLFLVPCRLLLNPCVLILLSVDSQ
jgi:hypothetical protein